MGSLRVGWMIYGSLGTMSGGYLYDRMMVEGLRAAGHRVEVISLPEASWFGALWHNWDNDLLEETLDLHLDVLVQDELNHPSLFWFNRRLRRHSKVPIVTLVHHLRSSENHPDPLRALYRGVEKAFLETAGGFVFNSYHTRSTVDAISPIQERPWKIIHPGKDRLGSPLSEEAVRTRCRSAGPLKLLFVGNIIPRKGLLPLLRVLKSLPADLWRLKVVGSQAANRRYYHAVRREAEGLPPEQVEFAGLQPDAAMRTFYESSDIFALPSDIEGYGIAYAEAQGFGLPSLAAAKGGAGEIIVHGRNGWLVNFGQTEKLREALVEVIRNREALERLSLESLENYRQLSGWEKSQQDFIRFIEEESYRKTRK